MNDLRAGASTMTCSSRTPHNECCYGQQPASAMEQCQRCLRVFCYCCIQQHSCGRPWFLLHERALTWAERLRTLFGLPVKVRFDSPDGECHAACNLTIIVDGGDS